MEKEKFAIIPLDEQETTISFNRISEQVDVWTSDRTTITKLDKLCNSSPEMYRCKSVGKNNDGEVLDKQYVIADKRLLSFKPKRRVCAPLTDEQKETRAKQLRALRQSNGVQ